MKTLLVLAVSVACANAAIFELKADKTRPSDGHYEFKECHAYPWWRGMTSSIQIQYKQPNNPGEGKLQTASFTNSKMKLGRFKFCRVRKVDFRVKSSGRYIITFLDRRGRPSKRIHSRIEDIDVPASSIVGARKDVTAQTGDDQCMDSECSVEVPAGSVGVDGLPVNVEAASAVDAPTSRPKRKVSFADFPPPAANQPEPRAQPQVMDAPNAQRQSNAEAFELYLKNFHLM